MMQLFHFLCVLFGINLFRVSCLAVDIHRLPVLLGSMMRQQTGGVEQTEYQRS